MNNKDGVQIAGFTLFTDLYPEAFKGSTVDIPEGYFLAGLAIVTDKNDPD